MYMYCHLYTCRCMYSILFVGSSMVRALYIHLCTCRSIGLILVWATMDVSSLLSSLEIYWRILDG